MADGKLDNPPKRSRSSWLYKEEPKLEDSFMEVVAVTGGFIATGVLTVALSMALASFIGLYAIIGSGLIAPALGVLAWKVVDHKSRLQSMFAHGALVFGVVWFLAAGGCAMLLLGS